MNGEEVGSIQKRTERPSALGISKGEVRVWGNKKTEVKTTHTKKGSNVRTLKNTGKTNSSAKTESRDRKD